MSSESAKWQERWSRPTHWAGTDPAAFLVEALPWLPRGHALDLASGGGRNAVFLAAQGLTVTCVDQSRAALEKTAALARDRGIPVSSLDAGHSLRKPHPPRLSLIEADLDSFHLPISTFDVILCLNYLQRSLFPAISQALRPRGILVYETYTLDQLQFSDGPRNPDFLLQPGELRTAFPHLHTLFYRELSAGKGIASLLARHP